MLGARVLLRKALAHLAHQECVVFGLQQRVCTNEFSWVMQRRPISDTAVVGDNLNSSAAPERKPTRSARSLLEPRKVKSAQAEDLYLVSEYNKWFESCKGMSDSEMEESLKTLTKKTCDEAQDQTALRISENYITVLTKVLQIRDNEFTRQCMIDLMHRHTFSCLGKILIYAAENDKPWLHKAVQERISVIIPSITFGSEMVTAFAYIKRGLTSKDQMMFIETRAKYLCNENRLTTKSIIKILHLMAAMKYRSVDLIRSLVYSLYMKPALIDDTQLSLLFFAAAKLKIISPRMLSCLEILSSPVLGNPEMVSEANVMNMIISLGKIKWNNPALLTNMCSCLRDLEEMPTQRYCEVLMSCSMVGVLPDKIKQCVVPMLKKASQDKENDQAYLDIVWSILVFNIKSKSIYEHILSDPVVASLTTVSDKRPAFRVSSNFSKLLNIANHCRIEFKMELSDLLKSGENHGPATSFSSYNNQLAEMLVECLKCEPSYIEKNIWFPTGHIIDFRYLYDTKRKVVVSPMDYISPYDIKTEGKMQPADHMKWVAVLANSFRDTTIGLRGDTVPDARRRLAKDQLQQLGYSVVPVAEKHFMSDPDRVRKAGWLKEQLPLIG